MMALRYDIDRNTGTPHPPIPNQAGHSVPVRQYYYSPAAFMCSMHNVAHMPRRCPGVPGATVPCLVLPVACSACFVQRNQEGTQCRIQGIATALVNRKERRREKRPRSVYWTRSRYDVCEDERNIHKFCTPWNDSLREQQ